MISKSNYLKLKRILDVIISLIGLLVLSPILLITAILIKVESKGPAIFKQERLGLNGKVFEIYKFRSMCIGAEKSGVYSSKGDTRVTKIGRFIRATSIDELPQLINIIIGDMSIIGPRPTLTYHPWSLEKYTDEQFRRFSVRPGVTGWAQINGRKEVQWDKRIEYDVEYVINISFALDLKIFYKTIYKVLSMQDNVNTEVTTK
ncbi:sugar transferase [Paenibacillus sp. FSL A5-0031]|uniref:sugar transferase n=1 Tax=Paenibacillus sp. FSL A5-0031 TaxID=1920420 RepID=UPI00096CD68E|nr:sugar transferase [Paenibacillus sp. FSL A5-0031]OME82145.1 sugar transferase [Paenibacillus sp. FSL A5-0031]